MIGTVPGKDVRDAEPVEITDTAPPADTDCGIFLLRGDTYRSLRALRDNTLRR